MANGNDTSMLVSTTDSPEEVAAALAGTPAPAAAPAAPAAAVADPAAPAAAPIAAAPVDGEKPAAAAVEPAVDPNAPKPAEPQTEEQKEAARVSKAQKRQAKIQQEIDADIRRKHDARRDADAEEARLATLRLERQRLEGGAPAPAAAKPPVQGATFDKKRPEEKDVDEKGELKYPDFNDWVLAVGEWNQEAAVFASNRRIDEEKAEERARVERAEADRGYQEHLAVYNEKLEAYKATAPDFDAAYDDAIPDVQEILSDLGPNAIRTIDLYTTRDADNGPAMVHHLMSHTDEMRAIAALDQPRQLIALAKLDSRLGAATSQPGPSPRTSVTRAPEPITPVSSSPTASVSPNPETETFAQYKVRRRAEEAALAR